MEALPKPPQDPQALSEGIDQVVAKIRGYLNRKKHSERVKFEAVRRKIVNEILETELSYVNHLNMLIEVCILIHYIRTRSLNTFYC